LKSQPTFGLAKGRLDAPVRNARTQSLRRVKARSVVRTTAKREDGSMPLELEIDEEELALSCNCCGKAVRWMQGFARIDDVTSAMYSATLSSAHRDRRIHLVVGLGDWSDAASSKDRQAFAVQTWLGERSGEEGLVTGFVDESDVIIRPPESWGAFRSAAEMRVDSQREEALELVQEILARDPRLAKYVIEEMGDNG
jgi:hypothetical protein